MIEIDYSNEIWKPVKGYEGCYEISNMGRVKSLLKTSRSVIMSPSKNLQGYYNLSLFLHGKMRRHLVHRLVAEAFIPNQDNKPQVNHKNGNVIDNHVENLEWVTAKENMQHAFHVLKRKPNKPQLGKFGKLDPYAKAVKMFSKDGMFIKQFDCMLDAERELNIRSTNIAATCRGKRPSAGGYKWEYV